ncbi:MAG: outer membrane protein assembly factor BamD [Acidobacteriota bacterium]|nr:outer membrane protein assembly factor BamD [Acidobacteriota bacterium]
MAGVAVAALAASLSAQAQTTPAPAADSTQQPAVAQPANDLTLTNQPQGKSRKSKEEKVVQSKDTKAADKKLKRDNPLAGMDAKLPDKALYDKAMDATKHGRYDVARLDLQTLLNTYPDSQFQMRAKLAIADSWYKEGGTAALTQAEQEYRDFIIFYPNQPEAAEAQMRIGDIYFREMDKPDRDHSKAVHAQEEYRLMLQQFPDSSRIPEAAQRLREVQESLASAESDVAAFYASHLNWPATIARYQTVADSYPLYSHMDDVLVGLGDAYEAEAKYYRASNLPEAAKARLVTLYDEQAAAAYRKVVLEHSAAPHVEDARDRLAMLNLPIPTPTPEQAAASAALENSRGQYTLSKRAVLFLLHRPDTVQAATMGDPPLQDAQRTLAPTIIKRSVNEFSAAVNPGAQGPPAPGTKVPISPAEPAVPATTEAPPAAAPASSAPLSLQDVPAAGASAPTGAIVQPAPATSAPAGAAGGVGIEIVQPSGASPAAPAQAPASPPAFPGTASSAPAAAAPANNYGVGPVGPPNATPLAPIESAAPAPSAINEVPAGSQPPTQAAPSGKKKPKPAFDKSEESSSKHKKKKGLAKVNPF